jgi:hypothetical protein
MPAVQASEAGEAYKMNAHVPNRGKFFAFVRGDLARGNKGERKKKKPGQVTIFPAWW